MRYSLLTFMLLLGMFAVGNAFGQTIEWMPMDSTGDVRCLPGQGDCQDNEIRLWAGDATVTIFLQLDGWDPDDDGDPLLGAYQAGLDGTTYEGGLAAGVAHVDHPGNPGTPVGCDLATYGFDVGDCEAGVFQAIKICTSDTSDPVANADWLSDCTWGHNVCGPPATCPPVRACIDRPDWVFKDLQCTATVSCWEGDYYIGAASQECRDDDDEFPVYYGGTLIVDVPECAKGTYNLDFIRNVNFTMFNQCSGVLVPGLNHAGAQITIITGSCCYGIGTPEAGCTENVREDECELLPEPREYRPGVGCEYDCCPCMHDYDCNDGDACTTDWCDCCYCYSAPNYMVGIECCDPYTGLTQLIDDDNPCTSDICMPTGWVDYSPRIGPCDHEDRCTVNGMCQDGVCVGTDIQTVPCTTPGVGDPACDFGDDGAVECVDAGPSCPPGEDYCCDCPLCMPGVCDDDDPCTDDLCNPDTGYCSFPLSYVPGGECCYGGNIEVINDGDPCTVDACTGGPGMVDHERIDPGVDCVAPFGSRYLAISPTYWPDPIALLVTGDPTDPNVSCVDSYVQEDGTLGPAPFFQCSETWGTMAVRGNEIIPDTTYYVQIDDGTTLSDPTEVTTWLWADINNDTFRNVTDVQLIRLGIEGEFIWASWPNLDLIGTLAVDCAPQTILGVSDIQMALLCIEGVAYEDLPCPEICP